MTNSERRQLRKLTQELDLNFERAEPTLYWVGYCGFAPDDLKDSAEPWVFLFVSNNVDELRRWVLQQRHTTNPHNPVLQPPA